MPLGSVLKFDKIWKTMPETFPKGNKDHSFLTLSAESSNQSWGACQTGYGSLRPGRQRHLAGSVSLRNRCYGKSWCRSVKAAPSRTKTSHFRCSRRGMVSSAVYSGESRVLFVALGRGIAAASCSRAGYDYFLRPLNCSFSHGASFESCA